MKFNSRTFAELFFELGSVAQKRVFRAVDQNGLQLDGVTYGQLQGRAAAVATQLRNRSLAGQRVLLIYPPGLEFISAFLGCLASGTIAVPVSPPRRNRTRGFLTAIAADCKPAAVLTTATNLDQWRADFEQSRQGCDGKCPTPIWLASDSLERELIGDAESSGEGSAARRCERLIESVLGELPVDPSQLAFLQYTSGSTSSPRGVQISHANLMANSQMICDAFGNREDSRGVFWLPNYHDMGLIGGILQTIFTRGSSTLLAPAAFLQQPLRWLRTISDDRATVSGGPDFAYDLCARKATPEACEGLDLSSWELAFTGAETVHAQTLDRFAEAFEPYGFNRNAFYPCYGLAESTLIVSGGAAKAPTVRCEVESQSMGRSRAVLASAETSASKTLVGSGTQLPRLEHRSATNVVQHFRIVDPVSFVECDELGIGEVWVQGESVAQGYYNQPELTERVFRAYTADGRGPYMRTGDLAFQKAGELFVCGRIKDLILIRGQNYYPEDIEKSAQRVDESFRPGHTAAFTIAANGTERLVVVQELEPRATAGKRSESTDWAGIIERLRIAIAADHEVMVSAVALVKAGSIPQTSSGKTQRFACREQFVSGALETIASWTIDEATDRPKIAEPVTAPERFDIATDIPAATSSPNRLTATEIENWLVDHIANRLHISKANIRGSTPFVELGMSSLDAVEVTAELSQKLEQDLSPTAVYQYPTISALARWLGTSDSKDSKNAQPVAYKPKEALEPIAIVGIGCRFAGHVNSPSDYWQMLIEGRDTITEVPAERWNIDDFFDADSVAPGKVSTRWGGFIDWATEFDADFFGISPREAVRTDPQQRVMLEVVWEALEHASIRPSSLAGSKTGVYIGAIGNDYGLRQIAQIEDMDVFNGTGTSHAIIANRVSYFLDINGPSVTLDTACSSSLVTTDMACRALRSGEIDAAISGGVNLILGPEMTVVLTKAQMMAPDGRCKAFDAAANGYVRSEGCGAIVLKRLSDAIADGNPIYGLIRGTAVNHVGRSNGLSAPNGPAQEQAMRLALAEANVAPHEIGFVETHGTGTKLGDPIELEAIKQVYRPDEPNSLIKQSPLPVGSTKTNIGHTESAAGIAGLIKAILVLRNQQIPPHLHLVKPNPILRLDDGKIEIPTQLKPIDSPIQFAGVSSFGFGGTNAHVILQSYDVEDSVSHNDSTPRAVPELQPAIDASQRPELITLSARTPSALAALAGLIANDLASKLDAAGQEHTDALKLSSVAKTLNLGRETFTHRMACVVSSVRELQAVFDGFARGSTNLPIQVGMNPNRDRQRIAFLYTGQGSQYAQMGRSLYAQSSVFRSAIDACDAIFRSEHSRSLIEILFSDRAGEIDQTGNTQPAIFAVQYALTKLWKSWGIHPTAVMGHSVGEFAAACAAGVLSLSDAMRLIASRGALMQSLPTGGKMAAILAKLEVVQTALSTFPNVAIAAYNGPESIVISGPSEDVDAIVQAVALQGYRCKELVTSHAFHSSLIEPILDELTQAAGHVATSEPQLPIASNLTGQLADSETYADVSYWANHARNAVRFVENIDAIAQLECDTYIEIGPNPILIGMAMRCMPKEFSGHWVASMKQGTDDLVGMLTAAGKLFTLGFDLHWPDLLDQKSIATLELPSYPFERRRHYGGEVIATRVRDGAASKTNETSDPLLGNRLDLPIAQTIFESKIERSRIALSLTLAVESRILVNEAAMCNTILEAARSLAKSESKISIADIKFSAMAYLDSNRCTFQTVLDPEVNGRRSARLVYSKSNPENQATFVELLSASILETAEIANASPDGAASDMSTQAEDWQSGEELLHRQRLAGISRDSSHLRIERFRVQSDSHSSSDNLIAFAFWKQSAFQTDEKFNVAKLLDDALLLVAGVAASQNDSRGLWVAETLQQLDTPKSIDWTNGTLNGEVKIAWQDKHQCVADCRIVNEHGVVVLAISGLTMRLSAADELRRRVNPLQVEWIKSLQWIDAEFESSIDDDEFKAERNWLILDDCNRTATALSDQLEGVGHFVEVIDSNSVGDHRITEIQNCLDRIKHSSAGKFHAVIDLSNLSLPTNAADADENYHAATDRYVALLNFIHLISGQSSQTLPRIYVVTRGVLATEANGESSVSLTQATIPGLMRVISSEQPELRATLVDLPFERLPNELTSLTMELLADDDESQVAIRTSGRKVGRLAAHPDSQSMVDASQSLVLSGGTKLVTGGLGGLGLVVAQTLANRGAQSLVLIGRSAPTAYANSVIDQLRRDGIRVAVMQGDIGDRSTVKRILDSINQTDLPLTGVYHLAGVLDDGILRDQTAERFERVARAKALGGLYLHELTENLSLSEFVLFSSVSSIVGSPGQANYAAANTMLDGLASYRRSLGLSATSINWGSWSDVGMAASLQSADHERWKTAGVGWIDPVAGMQWMERILQAGLVQAAVMPMDWKKFCSRIPRNAMPSWLRLIASEHLPKNVEQSGATPELLHILRSSRTGNEIAIVRDHIVALAVRTLGLNSEQPPEMQRPLGDLGFDSLTGVEFCNAIGRSIDQKLSPTVLFDHPTLQAISMHVAYDLLGLSDDNSKTVAEPQEINQTPEWNVADDDLQESFDSEFNDRLLTEVESMSESEIEALVMAQLVELEL